MKLLPIDSCAECKHCRVNEKSFRLCVVKGLGVDVTKPIPRWCPLKEEEDND